MKDLCACHLVQDSESAITVIITQNRIAPLIPITFLKSLEEARSWIQLMSEPHITSGLKLAASPKNF